MDGKPHAKPLYKANVLLNEEGTAPGSRYLIRICDGDKELKVQPPLWTDDEGDVKDAIEKLSALGVYTISDLGLERSWHSEQKSRPRTLIRKDGMLKVGMCEHHYVRELTPEEMSHIMLDVHYAWKMIDFSPLREEALKGKAGTPALKA